jgi:hypothetical protein
MPNFLRQPFPPPTRLARPLIPDDVGREHVNAWKRHRLLAAYDAANARLAEAIRNGEFSRRKLALSKQTPTLHMDDADYLDGDLEMYGTYPAHEWGV